MKRHSLRHLIKERVSQADLPALFGELRDMHDRAAGILAATLLESSLEELLTSQMIRLSRDDFDQLFSGDAPLSSFSAKIRIARAFKMVHKSTASELIIVKEIRNVFAHAQVSVSFETPVIAQQITRLTTVDELKDPMWDDVRGETGKIYKLLRTDTPRMKYLSNCVFHMFTFRFFGPPDPDLMDDDES